MTTNQLITKIGRQRVVTALANVVCQGTGDVVGPSSSTNDDIVLFDGATGKLIKDSGVKLSAKQDALVSGTNIKTINNNSLLGSGDISVSTLLGFNPSRRILYRNHVSSSVTGTTNETLVDSFTIPAGTIQANDQLYIEVQVYKVGSAAAQGPRLRVGTTAGTGGTAIMTNSAGNNYFQMARNLVFRNSVSSQAIWPNTTNNSTSFGVTNVAETLLSLDFSIQQVISLTFQNGSAADTSTLRYWYIELIRQ